MIGYINDNGKLRPAETPIHTAPSAAALYGDGVFETIRWERGAPFLWDRHWERLSAGCAALRLRLSEAWNAEYFLHEMARTAGAMDACRIRLQVYASEDGGSEDQAAGYVISCGPLPARQEGGIRLGISTGAVKDPGPLSRFKTCNALPYRIAAREAAAVGWDDAILLNSIGQVVETSKSNIFLVKGGTVFVNNGAEGCIAGVMCGQLLEWMQEWSFQVTKCSLTIDALEGADEIFLTNSLRGVMPVTHLILPNHATERSLDIHFGEQLARLVEQKFMALHH